MGDCPSDVVVAVAVSRPAKSCLGDPPDDFPLYEDPSSTKYDCVGIDGQRFDGQGVGRRPWIDLSHIHISLSSFTVLYVPHASDTGCRACSNHIRELLYR